MVIDVPKEYEGQAISMLGSRKGEMLTMDTDKNITHFEFKVPSRGLIGLRNRLLSATRGEAVMYHNFYNYEPYKGDIAQRIQGVLVSMAVAEITAYPLDGLPDRGIMFVKPGDQVYEGMIVGEHCEQNDISVNVIPGPKKATNIRCANAEKGIKFQPPREFSLEMALEYIEDDELLEITPKTFRLGRSSLPRTNARPTGANRP